MGAVCVVVGDVIREQLLQVARLISLRNTLGLKRQIFFCSLGGFDTHTNETSANPTVPNGAGNQGNFLGAHIV